MAWQKGSQLDAKVVCPKTMAVGRLKYPPTMKFSVLSWKCRRLKCRQKLFLTTFHYVFPTQRHDTADVSATSCDVGFFFSVSYVVSWTTCRHVVVVTTYYSILF